MPRAICIIEARLASTRLPGKVLLPVVGKPLLELLIERVRRATSLDGVVIATTDAPADVAIVDLAQRLEVGVFRGSEVDVLDRVLSAARAAAAEVIVEITGDCPLMDPTVIDTVVADYQRGGADFVSNILPYTTPRGTDVRVFATEALAEIARTSQDPADREHVSLHFWEHPERYRIRNVAFAMGPRATDVRLTVDTPDDLELIRCIYERLYPTDPAFTLVDVLGLLDREPELARLNAGVEQKAVR